MITILIVGGLAVWQVIKIWNYSELFATRRAYAEASQTFTSRLLRCPFCLSNWVSAFLVGTLAMSEALTRLQPHFSECVWIPIASVLAAVPSQIFATARAANLCNDFFKLWDRTPRYGSTLEIKSNYDESDYDRPAETDRNSEGLTGEPQPVPRPRNTD